MIHVKWRRITEWIFAVRARRRRRAMEDERMKKKVLAAFLAAGMVLTGFPAAAMADEADGTAFAGYHVELEEAGSIKGFRDGYDISYNTLMKEDGDSYVFSDLNGNVVDDRHLVNVDSLGWGIYTISVETGEETVNSTALVTVEGETLVPAEAAFFEFPAYGSKDESPRYILAFYGTEVTDNEDEALFFVTERMVAISADEDDTLYKGVLKVYDLVNRRFVPGLEYEQGRDSSFYQVGDNLYVDIDGDKVYNPEGELVYEAEEYGFNATCRYMIAREDGLDVIMDAEGNKLFSTEESVSTISYDSDYFTLYKDGKYQIINCSGEPAVEGTYYTVYSEDNGRFRVKVNEDDEKYALVASDGSVIAEGEDFYDADELGYYIYGDSGNATMITPDNRIIEGLSGNSSDMFFTKDDAEFLVINTGEYQALPGSSPYSYSKGVFEVSNDDGLCALYDSFTGEELLGFEYDSFNSIGDDYIAAIRGGDAVIYKINVVG